MFSRWDAFFAGLVFVVALWVNLHGVPTTEFHRDEARWVHRARFLEELRDPTGSYWRESELTLGQPPLGSYLMGVGLLLQGRDLQTNGYYNFHYSQAWNQRHGNMPDELDLAAARRTNSVVGALIAVSVYLIASALVNPVAGLAAVGLLVPHPLSIYLSSLAGSDALVTLFVAWAALAAMALARRPTWPRALLLGLLLGLGGAAKLSPLGLAIPLAGAGLILAIQGWRSRSEPASHDGELGWRLLPQPAIAAAVFVALYPYLWSDPIRRTWNLVQFRTDEMYNQGVIWEELKVNGPVDALGRIGHWLGEVDSVTGQGVDVIAKLFGGAWKPMGWDLVLAVIGALILLALAIQHGLGSRWSMAALVLGGQFAVTVFGMRADFSRYLLPVLIGTAVCGGLVAGMVWEFAWERIARRWPSRRFPSPQPSPVESGEGADSRRLVPS
jgi:hypothetical protein